MLAPGYMTITIYLSIWRERRRGRMTGFHVPPAAFRLIVWTKNDLELLILQLPPPGC